jgi:GNAT superfamily N-acetyltransferase
MPWTAEAKLDATVRAPMHGALLRADTRVIERPGWYQLVTPSAPGTMLNEVILSSAEPGDVNRVIAEVVATYASTGHPVKWCVGPWTKPADFGRLLASNGFSSWAVRGMASDTSRSLRPAEGVAIGEVSEAELDSYVDAAMRGWSIPPAQAALDRETYRRALRASPRQVHLFAAHAAGEIAGTAALVVLDQYGYLAASQVLAPFRGRGVYRALVAAPLDVPGRARDRAGGDPGAGGDFRADARAAWLRDGVPLAVLCTGIAPACGLTP